MKMFLLSSDEDTLTGLRLAGIDGSIVKDEAEFDLLCEKAVRDGNVGILLITRTLAQSFPEKVLEIKKSGTILVTEVPDVYSKKSETDSITRYIREAIGVSGS